MNTQFYREAPKALQKFLSDLSQNLRTLKFYLH